MQNLNFFYWVCSNMADLEESNVFEESVFEWYNLYI